MTCYIGSKVEQIGARAFTSENVRCWRFIPTCRFTAAEFTAWCFFGETAQLRVGIYDGIWDTVIFPDQWMPNNLLTQTDPFGSETGDYTYFTEPFQTPVVLLPNVRYWIAIQGSQGESADWANIRQALSGTSWKSTYDNTTTWAGGFPDPWTRNINHQDAPIMTAWVEGFRTSPFAAGHGT